MDLAELESGPAAEAWNLCRVDVRWWDEPHLGRARLYL
ncbi:MAG: hypothetical protein K0S05_1447, partial [Agromyces sp.]|nr:hypothetical protein [Agromyces sp.]